MLPVRHVSRRSNSTTSYICLCCRVQSTQIRRDTSPKQLEEERSGQRDASRGAKDETNKNAVLTSEDGSRTYYNANGRRLTFRRHYAQSLPRASTHISVTPLPVKRVGKGRILEERSHPVPISSAYARSPEVNYQDDSVRLQKRGSRFGGGVDETNVSDRQNLEETQDHPLSRKEREEGSVEHAFDPATYAHNKSGRRVQTRNRTPPYSAGGSQRPRHYHTSSKSRQQATAAVVADPIDLPPDLVPPASEYKITKQVKSEWPHNSRIRTQLRGWQALNGDKEDELRNQYDDVDDRDSGQTPNNLTRLPDAQSSIRHQDIAEEEERFAHEQLARSSPRDTDSAGPDTRFLSMGDLVEIEFPRSERESVIAVFVRRLSHEAQFFTINGRWLIFSEKMIPYSIPGWVSPDLIKPLLAHLPEPHNAQEREELYERAHTEDLSVPRELSAPLVSRMVQFNTESLEMYRKHAGTLDDAHNILAHETDLRYGSLTSAATALLKIPANELPVTALFTVRKALSHAGFGFNIDRRSHRLTGYLQIRSKEQVRTMEEVRDWLRDWQDDLAQRASLQNEGNEKALKRHQTPRSAKYVYDFVEKARKIALQSRENRDATTRGNVGPSKTKLPITPDSESVRITKDAQFSDEDTAIVRFMEAWACTATFIGQPRLEALPPLILQATGLYEDMDVLLGPPIGFMFLQELGTIMPYENRVRFDQHLLLPSSQHSKPLQNLMTSLLAMKDKPKFSDSMKDLRHDWGSMRVYCIDDAKAHEIDDGLSVEQAGTDQWWVHVHIANPTAFFERDHPLAKMARHMGETIYMPERTYMMLPRWATAKYFSMARNRPCLTFSTKLDSEGRTLETKITPGLVHNVMRLTPTEVGELIGSKDTRNDSKDVVLTVGGEPPPSQTKPKTPQQDTDTDTDEQVAELKLLQHLAEKRSNLRRQAGGLFFEMHKPDIDVWQHWKSPGLAWDHPHRKGARSVEGDPVIRMRTQEMTNWFQPRTGAVDILVREMMLLACETAASWCQERQIPAIFRGLADNPDGPTPQEFLRDVLEPEAAKTEDGAYPFIYGLQYIQCFGGSVLRTHPVNHPILGMSHYGKVTSPLRRYGDMILHWQIEATLREEARIGQSLVTSKPDPDRSFLPFSKTTLETIMLGLQPRETIIMRAKSYAEQFWVFMLLFRAVHYNEAELPFRTPNSQTNPDGSLKPLIRLFVHTDKTSKQDTVHGISVDLNINMDMARPDRLGLGDAMMGDTWECEVEGVEVYNRHMVLKPVRLMNRIEGARSISRGSSRR